MSRYQYEPHINLFTKDLNPRRLPENFYFNLLMIGSGILLTVFLAVFIVQGVRYQLAARKNHSLNTELNQLRLRDQQLMQLSAELTRLKGDNDALLDSVRTVDGLLQRKYAWSGLLDDLAALMDDTVWLDRIAAHQAPGQPARILNLSLDGGGLTLADINRFVHRLESKYQHVKVAVKLAETDGNRYYTFAASLSWQEEAAQ